MSKITRRIFLGAGATAATVAIGSAIKFTESSAQSQSLNLYSARHYNTDKKLFADFTRQTGIKINLIEGEADPLIQRIKTEGRNSPADVLLTVDIARLWRANNDGLFLPVNSKTLNQRIPPSLRDPKGHWFAFSKRARVIMYRKEKISPSQLSTYEDLANPKWKGRIITRSSGNVYNQSLVAWMIAVNGSQATEKWARGLVANFARPPQGNDTAQIEAIAAGVADLALANTYYLARLGADKNPAKQSIFKQVGVFFPNQKTSGTHVNVSGAGVLRTAPNRAGAIKFLEYLSSPAAQEYFAQGNFEYPAVQGVKLDPILAQLGNFKSSTVNLATVGAQLPQAIQIVNRAGWK